MKIKHKTVEKVYELSDGVTFTSITDARYHIIDKIFDTFGVYILRGVLKNYAYDHRMKPSEDVERAKGWAYTERTPKEALAYATHLFTTDYKNQLEIIHQLGEDLIFLDNAQRAKQELEDMDERTKQSEK